jgi:hypothetical protein
MHTAIVKVDSVRISFFGDLPDIQGKRNQLRLPQFVEDLLSFYFQREWFTLCFRFG